VAVKVVLPSHVANFRAESRAHNALQSVPVAGGATASAPDGAVHSIMQASAEIDLGEEAG
jgi:hypothetical protein